MQTYEQLLIDNQTQQLKSKIGELLEKVFVEKDEDAANELELVESQISFDYSVECTKTMEVSILLEQNAQYDTYEEYEIDQEENDGMSGSPDECGFDSGDIYETVNFEDPEFNVYINGLAETASEDAKNQYTQTQKRVSAEQQLKMIERQRTRLEEQLAELLKKEEEL